MCARSCLDIILGVPVAVVDDDNLGSSEVDALATGFGGEQKDVAAFFGIVESVNRVLAVHGLHIASDLLETDGFDPEVVFKE